MIKVRGRAKLRRAFQALPGAVQEETRKAVMKSAEELARAQRGLVPVDSGELRDSIVATGPGETTPPYSQPGGAHVVPEYAAVVTAGNTDVRYPHLVEFGTATTQAQPYFWPPYRLLKKRLAGRISRAGKKGLRKAFGQ